VSARTRPCPRGHGRPHGRISLPSPPLPSPPPSPSLPFAVRAEEKKNKKIKIKIKIIIYFWQLLPAWKERKNLQFSVFGFQSPNSLNSPSSVGEAARRRRFFRPSSPSHPSKLYSSLGWLNSKFPKPFPPFSLRLIDVDGF
jgi:hypothetical protein